MAQNDEQNEMLDLSQSIDQLVADHPKLDEALKDFGLDDVDRTIPVTDVLDQMGVNVGLVATALESMGYECTGYTAPEDPYAPQLDAIFDALFNNDDAPSASASSVDPVVANMEAAVRKAQREGKLPQVD
ncbi:MAG: hypothetical protein ACI4B6_08205 [Atopobiaceae bacterium]